jgi:hypothetical protein
MKFIKRLTICIVICLLPACATTWHNPNKSSQQLYADRAYCKSLSGSGGSHYIAPSSSAFAANYNNGAAIGAAFKRDSIFEDCMMGQGWSKR